MGLAFTLSFAPAPPRQLVFPARPGDVVFPHARHVQAVKGNCHSCHDGLFPQDAHKPLNWKAGMHKPAEAHRTSCGACHHRGGTSFESQGNCRRCHASQPHI